MVIIVVVIVKAMESVLEMIGKLNALPVKPGNLIQHRLASCDPSKQN